MSDVPIFDPMTNVDPMRAETNEDCEDFWCEEAGLYGEMDGE